ncbi:hypothetical protein LOTGIDRAFT_231842 [Lottia gigantea]|uniref:EF-hand domain-containing protein n=1 Tax=Lottia gigantea TaxID=225164 RepID=V4C3K1_LOTGI|nr:hypothetical protein LOTGIDRAFT_231842 [Lottia gigantea]ESO96119.1 hypothetical protein LOTGIDRAFT_231842 [Lottia gigantea]
MNLEGLIFAPKKCPKKKRHYNVHYSLLPLVWCNSEPLKAAQLFDKVDIDKNDLLDRKELDSIFLLFDVDGDKQVSKAEFQNDWVNKFSLGNIKEADALFARADQTHDGVIAANDIDAIFTFFDVNGNSNVDLNEFLTQWGQVTLIPVNPIDTHVG